MGIYYFDIAALAIHLLNLLLFIYKRHLFSIQTRLFLTLLLISMSAAFTDVLGVMLFINQEDPPLNLIFGINTLFYMLQNSIPLVFLFFILAVSGRFFRFSKKTLYLLGFPWLLSMLLIISNIFTGLVFYFDEHAEYARGHGLDALYAIAFFYALFGVLYLIHDRKRLAANTLTSMLLFVPVTVIPAFIQFFLPELLIQNLGIALSELFILLTIFDFSAYIDRSMGLFNRDGLIVQLEQLLLKKRSVHVFVINMGSLNYLRHVLDTENLGSLDTAIKKRMFRYMNPECFAAILGTNQFALVMTGEHSERIDKERIHLLEQLKNPWYIKGLHLSISACICELRIPEDTDSIQTIFQVQLELEQADKLFPRNSIIPLSDLALEDTGRRLEIEQCMRKAIEHDGFEVYFQPIIDTQSEELVSAEALARLHDEKLGWISPGEFIPIAEQNGTIHRLGDFIMEKSCEFMLSLRKQGYKLSYIDVNLSSLQCLQKNIADRMLTVIQRYGLDPADIRIEITETAAAQSPFLMKNNLASLSDAGFMLAIDDFGTGHSNLYMLMGIPFSVVKLDRSLLLAMNESIQGRIGMESISGMFKKMGIPLVAEGVETAAELEEMRKLKVDLIQGYYFSKPLSKADFLDYAKERTV